MCGTKLGLGGLPSQIWISRNVGSIASAADSLDTQKKLCWYVQGEREVPELLAKSPSRRRRIARGSGRTDVEVSNLLAMFANMRSKMKDLSKLMNMNGAAGVPLNVWNLTGTLGCNVYPVYV